MNWDWEKLNQQQRQKGGGVPPQLDDFLNQLKNLKFHGAPIFIIVFIGIILAYTSFFKIEADEVGIITRFGRFDRTVNPGLNTKWPMGIERVEKVKVTRISKEEFGVPATLSNARNQLTLQDENSSEILMLTGDLNVALVPWIVQYRIKNPYNYLYKVKNVQVLLRAMSEATMRFVVGDRSINDVITKREEIAEEAKELLQAELDSAETGIQVVTIEMKKTNVPIPVQDSFNEVNQAIQEKERMIYQAKEEYNKAIPAAKGEADRTVLAAEGFALNRVNRAKGDVTRFIEIYKEYSKAKDVTKRRMYLEMLKTVIPKLGEKYIVDSDQKNVLPLLNLGKQTGKQSGEIK